MRHEAGVSTGAIYTYFPNKEAILRAILERARDERRSQLEAATCNGVAMDPGLVLLEWASTIFSARGQHAARVDVNLWAEALHNPRVQKLAEGALREATSAVSAVVSSRLTSSGAGQELDPGSVASVLIALFLGLEVQTAVGMRLKRTEVIRALVALFADYLPGSIEPRPPAVERTHRARKKR